MMRQTIISRLGRTTARGFCSSVAQQPVRHHADACIFALGEAVLEYRHDGVATVNALHTRVPIEYRGQGVAERLCDALYEHAQNDHLKITPSCSYIRDRYVPKRQTTWQHTLQFMDMATSGLQIEVDWNGVATLRLVDARRRNPLHVALLERMRDWLANVNATGWPDDDHDDGAPEDRRPSALVRCIVLESCGPVFSAGHDFRDFAGAAAARPAEVRRILDTCADVNLLLGQVPPVRARSAAATLSLVPCTCHLRLTSSTLTTYSNTSSRSPPVPPCRCSHRRSSATHQVSVAAVTGAALAGGAQLAASCDLVLARATDACFTLTGVHGGGFCHTPLVSYANRLPTRKALELAVLGDTIDASEAVRIGLANRAVAATDWRAEVDALSRRLATTFTRHSAAGKATLYAQAAALDARGQYRIATDEMVRMFTSRRWQAHMARFLDRSSSGTSKPH